AWRQALQRLGGQHEILVYSTGCDPSALEKWLQPSIVTRWQHLDQPAGIGTALRTALEHVRYPFLVHLTPDYPYTPADLKRLWERIHLTDALLHKPPDLVNGCRTGLRTPLIWRILSFGWQVFWRIASGFPVYPQAPWHGWRAITIRWRCQWIYGIPLLDPFSGLKIYRTDFLKRFPLQSDGPFVHIEIAAKATFLTSLVDEILLTPCIAPIVLPPPAILRPDCWRCFRQPQFTRTMEQKDPAVFTPPLPA
ncbi:MAG: hypothetical protein NZ703_11305, partial [Gemmataceae bacterium]|nr:hypothetical protein [Gemmataceae bacterium]